MRTDLSARLVHAHPLFVQLINPPPQPILHSRRRLALVGLLLLPCFVAQAEITLDGSLGGPSGPLAGPDFMIRADMGLQRGENLFHSFGVFEVLAGESATFTGVGATGPIARILSRVTGGSVSTIDGLLASTIPGADLYLLNPAGVVFGAGARLDVQGSFHVSTADYLTLEDEGRFAVSTDPEQSLLTSAPPAAFGFLGEAPPGAIDIQDATLKVPEGETLSVVGGEIDIRGGELAAPAGRHNLVSVASAGEVVLRERDVTVEDVNQLGRIGMTQSTIDASGESGGEIFIRGGELVMEDTRVEIDTTGAGNPGGIDLELSENLSVSSSVLISETSSSANSGHIAISAPQITLNRNSIIGSASTAAGDAGSITIDTLTLNIVGSLLSSVSISSDRAGNAGDISIQTDTMTLRDGATVASVTNSAGDGGDLTVIANKSILIEGLGSEGLVEGISSSLNVNNFGAGNAGFLFVSTPNLTVIDDSVIQGITFSEGRGGDIRLEVGTLTLRGGGQVSSGSGAVDNITGEVIGGQGQGANLTIVASDSITIADQDNEDRFASGLYTETYGDGNAGSMAIETPSLIMDDDSRIVTSTQGVGLGGNLQVEVGNLILREGAQISSSSGSRTGRVGTGNAGNIVINAKNMVSLLGNETVITSGTFGPGHAGNIFIFAPTLEIQNGASIEAFGNIGRSGNIEVAVTDLFLTNDATIGNTAFQNNGGNIAIDAENQVFISGSRISSGTIGSGQGGDIDLQAARIDVREGGTVSAESSGTIAEAGNAGNITLRGSEVLLDQNATVSTEALRAGGGNITIEADTLQLTRESPIEASVRSGEGSGGNVTLNAETMVALENSDITARADQGFGGNITLNADVFLRSPDVQLDASSNVIGNEGEVQINTPDLDIAGSITNLPTTFLDAASRLSDRCAARTADTVSSFVVTGAGGIPPGPEGASLSGYTSTSTNTPHGSTRSPADEATSLTSQLPALALFECGK